MSKEKVLVGVLAGIAAGALLGILFAPDKGSETRKKIAKKSKDTVDELKQKFENLMDDVSEKFEEGKVGLTDAYGKMKDSVEGFAKEAK